MILPLETFRGIFALVIVLHHLKIDTFIQNSKIIMNGGLVVDFFFVLSGFVISLNYLYKINTKDQLLSFQKKRFKRLYPLHVLTLLIFVGIEFIKLIVNNFTNLESTYEPFGDFNNLYSLVANFFLLHGWYGWSYNLPSWSISTEFYTYFIFGLIILISTNKLRFIIAAIFLSLIILLLNNFDIKKFDFFIYPARCIYSFFLGVIIYLIYEKFKNQSNSWFSLILIFASFAIIIISDQLSYNYKYILSPILFGLTILFVSKLDQESILYKLLSNKVTVYLGSISYGIYMIHFAFVWFFRQFSRYILNIPDNEMGFLTFDNYLGELFTLSFIIFIIFISHLSLHYFENKFR